MTSDFWKKIPCFFLLCTKIYQIKKNNSGSIISNFQRTNRDEVLELQVYTLPANQDQKQKIHAQDLSKFSNTAGISPIYLQNKIQKAVKKCLVLIIRIE